MSPRSRAAQRTIYMENQYFTSPLVAEALASKGCARRDGPEVVLISTEHSPSYFDQATMDKTRFDFVSHLMAADLNHRFRAYSPVTTLGKTIICPRQTDHHRRWAAADRVSEHQQPLHGVRHRMRLGAGGVRTG